MRGGEMNAEHTYKHLMKESRKYLANIIKKYGRAKSDKEKLRRVLLTYKHFVRIAAKLCVLHEDMENGKFEEEK
ncbi:unnamed protein product [marine sediment metagenome]|uniref:Uncharacterized protein n=1 Tax=marine sediment metagenome TaxID=412755 RepID=X0VGN8_9ZZZZ